MLFSTSYQRTCCISGPQLKRLKLNPAYHLSVPIAHRLRRTLSKVLFSHIQENLLSQFDAETTVDEKAMARKPHAANDNIHFRAWRAKHVWGHTVTGKIRRQELHEDYAEKKRVETTALGDTSLFDVKVEDVVMQDARRRLQTVSG